MKEIPADFRLSSYSFELPEDQIAQQPAEQRDASRLLVLNREDDSITLTNFSEIVDYLPDNAVVVANNSKVLPARIYGHKPSGGKVEFLLLTPLPLVMENKQSSEDGWHSADVVGLLRASKAPKPGLRVEFTDEFFLEVLERRDFGHSSVRLSWKGDLGTLFKDLGHYPLPPYIRRPDTPEDAKRYQTVYAEDEKLGSVAAPTAGLHFTPEVREKLKAKGIEWKEVTLYVGYGTFSPVRSEDIREHKMHGEYIEVPEDTAEAIRRAKAEGRPVFGIGTTSVRSLEGAFAATGKICAYSGWTDIFIYPGYTFNVVDKMLTNFHLPESSLIIMISALANRDTILKAYATALENKFRFFSYGDAMLIL
ncbi:tRNA preQ1(34) S-adenosylmethionine ribosyltransferase-isomerase QueA [Desulfobaculum bizertense]|uniref:S-adenosylmethionine:tRNA ribosyltransferase-isomerase n=1 Tax=Desulfobaculum bizertense DSM 18034 TaxID=1121442 RepID=A0A1T4X3A7_9BACT|nr:tRNA preQ1(34) S-adenosylmethionine ribosyltransferase-isomerase QueA [Desulfobaculum bizertense]UIJ37371.1 tRNA preQ1(34) S-adenosylmethionine ribosyltransferase-isomerase QueA [Desulfobaculum bizertense]SKA83545.1 S-adenosylmethionine:tRNA ribosyltransferase-isomerase [Desulfobaculum bizertense DSM 18034]